MMPASDLKKENKTKGFFMSTYPQSNTLGVLASPTSVRSLAGAGGSSFNSVPRKGKRGGSKLDCREGDASKSIALVAPPNLAWRNFVTIFLLIGLALYVGQNKKLRRKVK